MRGRARRVVHSRSSLNLPRGVDIRSSFALVILRWSDEKQLAMEFPPSEVKPVVARIAEILNERKETIAIAEAACGGLISAYLVSVPGASSWYHGGTLTYSLKSRLKLSGWSEQEVQSYTGPSEPVAQRLARNLKLELGSTYALSETGWAGPTADDNSEIGTVYFAIATPKGEVSIHASTGSSSREANMAEFALRALRFLQNYLEKL
ncbi:hypothetical protein TRVA0_028S01574 [Trichomonascus vanleenenianus]|uniref:CinA family protein n=1 Tax=Trichomonascus vanleenenianus TaxID=2268995 RepID=UPI003ECA1308